MAITAGSLSAITTRPWYRHYAVNVLATNLVPAAASAVAAGMNYSGQQRWIFFSAALWLAAATVVQIRHSRQRERDTRDKDSLLDITGCLHTMHAALLAFKTQRGEESGTGPECRITVHAVHGPLLLEQLVNYVGGPGKEKTRRISGRGGVVGRCITTNEPAVMHRLDGDLGRYHAELRSQWAMTEDEAKSVTCDRMSFMSVPIAGVDGNAIGVVYLDSGNADFFDEATQEFVIRACDGLVKYIDLRQDSR